MLNLFDDFDLDIQKASVGSYTDISGLGLSEDCIFIPDPPIPSTTGRSFIICMPSDNCIYSVGCNPSIASFLEHCPARG